ncbi:MAG TPA: aldolase/citrate lyase family protein [Planctomycetota bacterium]
MTDQPRFQAGRRGDEVRGDCWLGFDPAATGDLEFDFRSRVEVLYGEATRELLQELFASAGFANGRLSVDDQGAYPFVLRARAEALLRQVLQDPLWNAACEPVAGPCPPTVRVRPRRSRLYLPGNEPKYMLNAALHGPDAVILDLEDSVAPAAKSQARSLVRHALHSLDWGACERMVRINQGDAGLADLAALAGAPFHLVLVPKVERPAELAAVDAALGDRDVLLMPILESALGIENAFAIAQASPRNVALTIGLEDLTADLGIAKTAGGAETLWARSRMVHAAKATGLQAIDSVYGDVDDDPGFRASLREARALGFQGKGCVHPRQIAVVHQEMAPRPQEVEHACRIARAFEAAQARGQAVVSLGSKMIDPPVVKRALATVAAALEAGSLPTDWREREPKSA